MHCHSVYKLWLGFSSNLPSSSLNGTVVTYQIDCIWEKGNSQSFQGFLAMGAEITLIPGDTNAIVDPLLEWRHMLAN